MPEVQAGAPPSPQLFFETANAFHRTEALKAAIQLEIFTAIGEGNQTAAAIARRCQTSERGTRILCDALVIMGFLKKNASSYSLTQDSAVFLDRKSPAYLGTAIQFLVAPQAVEGSRRHRAGTSDVGGLRPRHGAHDEDAGGNNCEILKGG
jgi:hypothetical protein